jgi:hypothetical protein
MLIPVVNAQQAGLVASSADMNAYSQAASFLCSPPMAVAPAHPSAQSLTGGSISAINWGTPTRDNDNTWSSGAGNQFTIQTQGFYEAAAHVYLGQAANTAECWIQVTTGTGNPAGSGITTSCWHASLTIFTGQNTGIGCAGLIPVLLYPTDVLQFMVQPQVTCTTAAFTSLSLVDYWGDWSHRMVST